MATRFKPVVITISNRNSNSSSELYLGCYNILYKEILSMIKNENKKTIFKENLLNYFSLDKKNNNFHNAYIWFRYYIYNRWLSINNINSTNY